MLLFCLITMNHSLSTPQKEEESISVSHLLQFDMQIRKSLYAVGNFSLTPLCDGKFPLPSPLMQWEIFPIPSLRWEIFPGPSVLWKLQSPYIRPCALKSLPIFVFVALLFSSQIGFEH